MKKVNLVLLALCALSCSRESVEQKVTQDENVVSLINKLGLDSNSIIIKGDSIFVEGDILLFKSKLLKTSPRQATFFQGRYNLVGNANDNIGGNIKYYISPNLVDHNSVQSALEEFQNVSANVPAGFPVGSVQYVKNNISVSKVEDPNQASIIIEEYSGAVGEYGYSELPTYISSSSVLVWPRLVVASKIHVNSLYWSNLSSAQRKFLVAHEFGHAIGLRHTDWRGRGEGGNTVVNGVAVGAYTVTNTNNTSNNPDPGSIFNGGQSGVPNWNGFTYNDIRAVFYTTSGTIIQ
ncbi:M57 family metalloprotease [Sphingobacterium sp. BIGb0116]|uniref:M57 family metalloprotease n=1 Tax=Sphingobacterium sp. BIGb0116 TaxID=2940619 RepID=UPI002166FAE7|nr:M57 family metalloprotease [Sphingobacterium sp. BIGb0116]MCS4166382.1 hypothetical protein [Sphingobacterium sp. BIGb0116]